MNIIRVLGMGGSTNSNVTAVKYIVKKNITKLPVSNIDKTGLNTHLLLFKASRNEKYSKWEEKSRFMAREQHIYNIGTYNIIVKIPFF